MESEFLAWLRQAIPPHAAVLLGPGDDAALVRLPPPGDCLVTVDMLMDQVDFDLAAIDPRLAGRKALAVNLSDLAAMAARPLAAVVALALPRQGAYELGVKLYEGLLPLAAEYDVAIAGGDINSWNGPLAISITLLGSCTGGGPLRRSGALPGDWLLATGQFGGSILGRHLEFAPRVREAILLHERYELHAAIDVSDGLALDLGRLCDESGCGAVLELGCVPIAAAAYELAARPGEQATPLDHALGDGEDFELLLAVPPPSAERLLAEQPLEIPVTRLGEFVAQRGLWQRDEGKLSELARRGFLHG